MEKAVSILVKGHVQHVGYRRYAELAAKDYHIVGKIENCPDKSVYIEAQGEEEEIENFLDYCRKGPIWANVESIEINEIALGDYSGFEIV